MRREDGKMRKEDEKNGCSIHSDHRKLLQIFDRGVLNNG